MVIAGRCELSEEIPVFGEVLKDIGGDIPRSNRVSGVKYRPESRDNGGIFGITHVQRGRPGIPQRRVTNVVLDVDVVTRCPDRLRLLWSDVFQEPPPSVLGVRRVGDVGDLDASIAEEPDFVAGTVIIGFDVPGFCQRQLGVAIGEKAVVDVRAGRGPGIVE